MKDKKRRAKALLVVEYHVQARQLAGQVSANQRRFLEVGATRGKEREPPGLQAGARLICPSKETVNP